MVKGLVWFMDGSRTGAGVYGQSVNRRLSIPVGKHATVFQAEVQGGSNMTGTDLYVNKPHCAAAVRP